MLLCGQGGTGNWIFFCRPLLCSDHCKKFSVDSSLLVSLLWKVIIAVWFADHSTKKARQKKCYFSERKCLEDPIFSELYIIYQNSEQWNGQEWFQQALWQIYQRPFTYVHTDLSISSHHIYSKGISV